MNIRNAIDEDFIKIEQLFEEHYSEIKDDYIFKNLTKIISQNEFNENLKSDNVYMKVAELDSVINGFAIGFIKNVKEDDFLKKSKLGILYNIVVKKIYRNKGIGKSLLNDFEIWCASNNVNRIEFNVFHYNSNAYSFYEKNGYHIQQKIYDKML